MDVLHIERADGTRTKVSLRRYDGRWGVAKPERVAYEYDVLRTIASAGVPAPRPIYLDAAGELLGLPAVVLSYLPGRVDTAPKDLPAWIEALAQTLVSIHAVTPETADLSVLDTRGRDGVRTRIDDLISEAPDDAFVHEILAALSAHRNRIEPLPPALMHNDFWPGNVIWNRGRVAGVIDWGHARISDPRQDVAEFRSAVNIDQPDGTTDDFLAAYERLSGRRLADMWFFDLLRGVTAYIEYRDWLVGYADLGHHLDPVVVERRIRAFLQRALDEAGKS